MDAVDWQVWVADMSKMVRESLAGSNTGNRDSAAVRVCQQYIRAALRQCESDVSSARLLLACLEGVRRDLLALHEHCTKMVQSLS